MSKSKERQHGFWGRFVTEPSTYFALVQLGFFGAAGGLMPYVAGMVVGTSLYMNYMQSAGRAARDTPLKTNGGLLLALVTPAALLSGAPLVAAGAALYGSGNLLQGLELSTKNPALLKFLRYARPLYFPLAATTLFGAAAGVPAWAVALPATALSLNVAHALTHPQRSLNQYLGRFGKRLLGRCGPDGGYLSDGASSFVPMLGYSALCMGFGIATGTAQAVSTAGGYMAGMIGQTIVFRRLRDVHRAENADARRRNSLVAAARASLPQQTIQALAPGPGLKTGLKFGLKSGLTRRPAPIPVPGLHAAFARPAQAPPSMPGTPENKPAVSTAVPVFAGGKLAQPRPRP